VSSWVATEVVKVEQLKQRAQVLSKFIEIAEKCRSYNNFNAVMEVISGLQSSSVYRLRQTWGLISNKQKDLCEQLKDLLVRQGNFSKFRKHLKTCNPPCIPYLGVYLTDLTFIEDGNRNQLEGGLINFMKRRRLASVIGDIQQYQLKPYNLEAVPIIQDFLQNLEILDEDQTYKLSLLREQNAQEKEREKKRKTTEIETTWTFSSQKDTRHCVFWVKVKGGTARKTRLTCSSRTINKQAANNSFYICCFCFAFLLLQSNNTPRHTTSCPRQFFIF